MIAFVKKDRGGANSRAARRPIPVYEFLMNSMIPQTSLENPVGNTGLNDQKDFVLEPCIDWVDCVSRVSTQKEVDRLISFITCSKFDPEVSRVTGSFYKGCQYHHRVSTYLGAEIVWSLPEDLPGLEYGRVRVSIPGTKFARQGFIDSWRMVIGLFWAYKMRATRFDATVDIFGDSARQDKLIGQALRAGKRGDFTGADTFTHILKESRSESDKNHKAGQTLYFGSPSSDKRLAIYDKRLESDGKVQSIRFEARLRGDIAHQAFQRFASLERDRSSDNQELQFEVHKKLIASICFGCVDFVKRKRPDGTLERACRSPRLSWYQELVDFSGDRMLLTKKLEGLDLEKIFAWLTVSVAPTLATVCESIGHRGFYNWLRESLAAGRKRLSPRQKALIKVSSNFDLSQYDNIQFEDSLYTQNIRNKKTSILNDLRYTFAFE